MSVRYENNRPVAIETVVLSTQHDEDVTRQQIGHGGTEAGVWHVDGAHGARKV